MQYRTAGTTWERRSYGSIAFLGVRHEETVMMSHRFKPSESVNLPVLEWSGS
jgi:hypothetical protein